VASVRSPEVNRDLCAVNVTHASPRRQASPHRLRACPGAAREVPQGCARRRLARRSQWIRSEAVMTTDIACPICRGGVLTRAEGKLEQSGDSYLPTVVWSCALCGYTRYEPAPHVRWEAERTPAAPPAEDGTPRRAA
jgi:hypothetical protein